MHPFSIYNASAGSGKTYTLVKEYLKILLKSSHTAPFKNILALTFTNKAVAEMKSRIIQTLEVFSDEAVLKGEDVMFKSICEEIQIAPLEVHKKSVNLLNTIMHNYAAFDISTIDGFTHKLIRTFAYDLKLPLNFEVELDQNSLLNEAVDSLISKAGHDKALTKVLVDFAIEKADDDKSYNLAFDLNKIAKLLVNENDLPFINTLKDKSLHDFNVLKKQLRKEAIDLEKDIVENGVVVLALIESLGLEFKDFSSAFLPKHFEKLANKNFNVNLNAKWQVDIESKVLYPKRVSASIASSIDKIQPQLANSFNATKRAILHLKFLKAFYKNMTPLSVLKLINNELQALKTDQNKMLISEFNTIISTEIGAQPTPFIYERLGEKFKYYFIDEFQDTSVMQWQNLMPLLDNSLAGDSGSAMLVGDAKQAIYRWRGGKAEQFIELFNKKSIPFYVKQDVRNLEENYRSFNQIVTFNNGFFTFLADRIFTNTDYKSLYANAHQNVTKKDDGYVSLTFLESDGPENKDEIFTETILKTINTSLDNGFNLADICILVRKKKDGVVIADYLSQNKIPIISSDTLLINNAPDVVFVNDLLKLLVQPQNSEIKIKVLNYLALRLGIEDKHDFFVNRILLSNELLFKSLEEYNIIINSPTLLQLPLYDLAETIIRAFSLVKISNAYIQFYLDIVLDFTQKKGSDITEFLNYFEKKKESLSIISPQGQDAIQIMTIHKSKGLEFPVVIFPYADLDIYKELDAKEWFSLDKQKYNGFSHTLLSFNKDFENFGDEGLRIFNKHKSEQELDNINLLYVVLTRPVEQIYIISSKDISAKGVVSENKYSGLFINYLQQLGLWNDGQDVYTFGNQKAFNASLNKEVNTQEKTTELQTEFISTAKEDHNIKVVTKSGLLWDTKQQEAIEKGNLIHNIMAQINTKDDIDFAINTLLESATINKKQILHLKETINSIVTHPELEGYYNLDYTAYNERDIISKEGLILRPDKVVVDKNNEAVIIDYKTGFEDNKHWQQLYTYEDVLMDMSIRVTKKVLVYINKSVDVKVI